MAHSDLHSRDSRLIPASYIRSLLGRYSDTLAGERLFVSKAEAALQAADAASGVPLHLLLDLTTILDREIGPQWTVDAAATWRTPMHGALDVATRSCDTVGDAVKLLAQYGHVRAPYLRLDLSNRRGLIHLKIVAAIQMNPPVCRALTEAAIFGALEILRQVGEGNTEGISLKVDWPQNAGAIEFTNMAGIPIHYAAPETALIFQPAALARQSPFRDPDLLASALTDLEQAVSRQEQADSLAYTIGRMLAQAKGTRPSEKEISARLAISRRSLVRKLADEGTNYRTLLDESRKARAVWLRGLGTLSRDEIAEDLGYSDSTSLSRAYRRWFRDE